MDIETFIYHNVYSLNKQTYSLSDYVEEINCDVTGSNPLFIISLNKVFYILIYSTRWNSLFDIDVEEEGGIVATKNFLATHGQCSIRNVQRDSANYINTMSRKRQSNYQLFLCLTNTVDEHTKCTLANEEKVYTFSGPPCGVTYLKLLMKKLK